MASSDVCTGGPRFVDDAFYILSSDGCRAASGHLRNICNWRWAIDSSVGSGIFANGYGTPDPEIGVDLWVHQMICWPDVLSLRLMYFGISCLDMKLRKNLWLWQWHTGVDVILQLKNKLPFIFSCLVEKVSCCPKNVPHMKHYNGKGATNRFGSNSALVSEEGPANPAPLTTPSSGRCPCKRGSLSCMMVPLCLAKLMYVQKRLDAWAFAKMFARKSLLLRLLRRQSFGQNGRVFGSCSTTIRNVDPRVREK